MPGTDVPHPDSSTLCGPIDYPVHCHGIPCNISSDEEMVKETCPRVCAQEIH